MAAACALDELWHPAAATALERALHPAGHGPNSSSLLRPQAAVVAVAYSAEKIVLQFVAQKRLRAFLSYFFTIGVVKERSRFPTEPENSPKRVSGVKRGFRKVRRLS